MTLIEISMHLIACISKALTSRCGGLLLFLSILGALLANFK